MILAELPAYRNENIAGSGDSLPMPWSARRREYSYNVTCGLMMSLRWLGTGHLATGDRETRTLARTLEPAVTFTLG